MLEALKMFTLSPQKAKERLRYENPQEFEQQLASGRNHLIIFGHYANWEWLMFTKLLYPRMRTIALYQRIENAFVNDCALHARERFGMEAMQAKHALLGLARLKNDGETMVAFVADQSPARPLIKHWTKFFGVDTPVHIGVHSLAVALKYDVIFLDMRRTSRGHYSVRTTRIYTPGEQVAPYDIIDRFFVRLEAQIREKPEGLALVASPLEVLPPWGGRKKHIRREICRERTMEKENKPLRVAVVVLNWNGRVLLEKFLPSLVENNHPQSRIYVADNASTDDSLVWLAEHYPQVGIIRNDRNYGFAKGYNVALEGLEEDLFVLVNSDIEVTPGWLDPAIRAFENDPGITAAQPRLRDYKDKRMFEYAGAAGGFIDKLGYPYCRGRIFTVVEEDRGQYDC